MIVSASCPGSPPQAAESQEPKASGAVEAATGRSLSSLLSASAIGVTVGGWLSAGLTYNNHNPANHSNQPVTFNDRALEPQLDQFYLYVERVANKESRHWDLGFRADFMFGTDARFTQAAGDWDMNLVSDGTLRFYKPAFPQAYLELVTPFVRGATLKLGHFYTILGQEVVPATGNFFYSHAYAMQYGEPFTHTGLLASYPATGNWTLNLGAVLGPHGKDDNFSEHLGNWNFLGGVTWLSDDGGTSLAAALTSGPTDDPGSPLRSIGSLVFNRDISEKLHYTLQYDHGMQEQAGAATDATWYGINQYLTYALDPELSLGLRCEWFRDQAGFRVMGVPASYYETTAGMNWKPFAWLLLRAETRYDWVDGDQQVFDVQTRGSQLTVGANAVLTF